MRPQRIFLKTHAGKANCLDEYFRACRDSVIRLGDYHPDQRRSSHCFG
jgi:hypothetical protein